MTPFEEFYAGPWQHLLEATTIPADAMAGPEAGDPSWDRKAAWLFWQYGYGDTTGDDGGRVPEPFNAYPWLVDALIEELRRELGPTGPVLTEDGY